MVIVIQTTCFVILVTELGCNFSMFTEYSVVSLPNDDGWFRVECSQPGNTSVATTGEIQCVDSEWETACNTVSNMTTCCFNDSSQMPSTSPKPSTPGLYGEKKYLQICSEAQLERLKDLIFACPNIMIFLTITHITIPICSDLLVGFLVVTLAG